MKVIKKKNTLKGTLFVLGCECGGYRISRNRNAKRCVVCNNRESSRRLRIHGHTKNSGSYGIETTPEYKAWLKLRDRCNREKAYRSLCGKISYPLKWNNFLSFLKDVGEKPTNTRSKYVLCRMDREQDYSKMNCKWTTKKECGRLQTKFNKINKKKYEKE